MHTHFFLLELFYFWQINILFYDIGNIYKNYLNKMDNKIYEVHCNSSESIIHSSQASDFFQDMILDLEIEDKEYVLSLFKRVKAVEKVCDEELSFLYDLIISEEFIKLYNEKIATFKWKKEKLKNLEYFNMLSSFYSLMNKSKVIHILDLWADEIIFDWRKYLKINIWKKIKLETNSKRWKINIDWNNDNFEKFRNRWKKQVLEKYKYLEFIDETEDYLLWIDLKSKMFLVIDKLSNEIIIKSKENLEFKKSEDNDYIFVKAWEEKLYLLYLNNPIYIKENIITHYIWKQLYLIDSKINAIFKIWWKLSLIWEWEILEINWNEITFFNIENNITLIYDIEKSEFRTK